MIKINNYKMVKIGNYEYSEKVARLFEINRRRGIELMISERTGVEYMKIFVYEDYIVQIGVKWIKDYSELKDVELEHLVEQIILDYTFNT